MKKPEDTMDMIKQMTQQKGAELREAAKGAVTVVNKSVHDKPWYYLGGAAFVGFLAGIFTRSRRKSNDS